MYMQMNLPIGLHTILYEKYYYIVGSFIFDQRFFSLD